VDKTKHACEEVGRAAVYPMIKEDLLLDRLTRANERLRIIDEIERDVRMVDSLKAKWKALTGQDQI
jgi:hypothetical protein